ncbi:DgyrCDS12221 [Dimorphilus gyrociliatus]|uniref:DgyrCDS12221 n=1 Tax=Dimorphilus gyrociliatus TaxID=2664684 RepID=A0A7I8W7L1_9ANNE|nr:DgyrCDS12221 [Dimorphilus gyrociliatus]
MESEIQPWGDIAVLFVCENNTTQSTMAQAVMTKICIENNMEGVIVDSRGWDCKENLTPDELTLKVLNNHGIVGLQHKSKKITLIDFDYYDFVICMHDRLFRQCYELMNSNGKACRAYIKTLSDYDPYRDRKCPPKREIAYPYFPV